MPGQSTLDNKVTPTNYRRPDSDWHSAVADIRVHIQTRDKRSIHEICNTHKLAKSVYNNIKKAIEAGAEDIQRPQMWGLHGGMEDETESLRIEVAYLKEENDALRAENNALREEITRLRGARSEGVVTVDSLEGGGSPGSTWSVADDVEGLHLDADDQREQKVGGMMARVESSHEIDDTPNIVASQTSSAMYTDDYTDDAKVNAWITACLAKGMNQCQVARTFYKDRPTSSKRICSEDGWRKRIQKFVARKKKSSEFKKITSSSCLLVISHLAVNKKREWLAIIYLFRSSTLHSWVTGRSS